MDNNIFYEYSIKYDSNIINVPTSNHIELAEWIIEKKWTLPSDKPTETYHKDILLYHIRNHQHYHLMHYLMNLLITLLISNRIEHPLISNNTPSNKLSTNISSKLLHALCSTINKPIWHASNKQLDRPSFLDLLDSWDFIPRKYY